MAQKRLPTDYTDAVWDGLRKYVLIENGDGTVSLQDVTAYMNREKSFFGAKDANNMNSTVNELGDTITDIVGYLGYTAPDIYGVEVDFENNKITRLAGAVGLTPGADFDNITPWHRRRCNVTHDGDVTAYYGDEGYSETGFTTTEITPEDSMTTYPVGTPVNVMVEQLPFYVKFMPIELQPLGNGKYAITKARYYISLHIKTVLNCTPCLPGRRYLCILQLMSLVYTTHLPGCMKIS